MDFTLSCYTAAGVAVGLLAGATFVPRRRRRTERFQEDRSKPVESPRSSEMRTFQSQKLETLGRLAGGVAHDFNNLLTVILGYADLLSQHGADEYAREVGGEIQKAGERAAGLTRQLLAFSRKQVLQLVVLDLNDLVQNLDKMLRRLISEDIDLTARLASSTPSG